MIAWTLVFHITGLVFWLGSLIVVTQIAALHTEEANPETLTSLGRLETKILRGLTHPGAAIVVITGIILLVLDRQAIHQPWLHIKLALVVILIVLDLRLAFRLRRQPGEAIVLSRRECRFLHGAISLAFLLILVLVMIRPF